MPNPINQASLIGGELSPTLSARVDLERYGHSVERMENFVVNPHGGAENRAGTEFFGATKYQSGDPHALYQVRLITFAPSSKENFILEFGHQYLWIWNKNGRELAPNTDSFIDLPLASTLYETVGYVTVSARTQVSQKFVIPAGSPMTISTVSIRVGRSAQIPLQKLIVRIFDDSAGEPGAQVMEFEGGQIYDIPVASTTPPHVSNPFTIFEAVEQKTYSAGTILHVVVQHEMETPDDAGYFIGLTATDEYAYSGLRRKSGAGAWSAESVTDDLCLSVEGFTGYVPVEIVTPYTSAPMDDIGTPSMVSQLTYTQSVDVMTICDATGVESARRLTRDADGLWSLEYLEKFVSRGEPSLVQFHIGAAQPSAAPLRYWTYAVSGIAIDGTESLPTYFENAPVGADISLSRPITLGITVGDVVVDHYAVYKGLNGTYGFIGYARSRRTASEIYDATFERVYQERYTYWRRYWDNRSTHPIRKAKEYATVDAIAAATAAAGALIVEPVTPNVTVFQFKDDNLAPDYTDQPRNGANQFTQDGGLKPRAVAYFQQRLVFANVAGRPDTLFFSEVGDYNSFQRSTPTVDDDAIEATLAAGELNEIRHLVPLRSLLVMTAGAEHVLTSDKGPITPSNIDAAPLSHRGVGRLLPLVLGNVVLFKDLGGQIREWIYDQNSNDYPAVDLGFLASHLFEKYKVTDWAYASAPRSVVWCVRSDGTLLSFTYVREQSVAGWARHSTALTGQTGRLAGKFRAVAATRNPDTGLQDLYFVVTRNIDEIDYTLIERQRPRDITTSPFCDSSVTQSLRSQETEGRTADGGAGDWAFLDMFRPALYEGTADQPGPNPHVTITGNSLKDDRLSMAPHSQMGTYIHAGGFGSIGEVIDNTEDTFIVSSWTVATPGPLYPWTQTGGWDGAVELYRDSQHQLDPLVPEFQNVKGTKMILRVENLLLTAADNGVKWINLFMGNGERYRCKVITVVTNNGPTYTPVAGGTTSKFYIVELERTIDDEKLLTGPDDGPAWDGTRWEEAKQVWTMASHLGANELLAVQADYAAHEPVYAAPAGTITLNQPANRVSVGLPYNCTIKSLRVSSSKMDARTNQKVITRVHVDVTDTLGISAGIDESDLAEFQVNTLLATAEHSEGRIAVRTSNRPERSGQIIIRQSKPLPASILSLTPEVELGG